MTVSNAAVVGVALGRDCFVCVDFRAILESVAISVRVEGVGMVCVDFGAIFEAVSVRVGE